MICPLETEGFQALPSAVEGGGLGLFTLWPRRAGSEVCSYTGQLLATSEAIKRGRDKSYLMRLGPQVYVDARRCDGKQVGAGSTEGAGEDEGVEGSVGRGGIGCAGNGAGAGDGVEGSLSGGGEGSALVVAARYINDCRNPRGYNVYFDKRPRDRRAAVVALRDIAAGEELFADYGKRYWRGGKACFNLASPSVVSSAALGLSVGSQVPAPNDAVLRRRRKWTDGLGSGSESGLGLLESRSGLESGSGLGSGLGMVERQMPTEARAAEATAAEAATPTPKATTTTMATTSPRPSPPFGNQPQQQQKQQQQQQQPQQKQQQQQPQHNQQQKQQKQEQQHQNCQQQKQQQPLHPLVSAVLRQASGAPRVRARQRESNLEEPAQQAQQKEGQEVEVEVEKGGAEEGELEGDATKWAAAGRGEEGSGCGLVWRSPQFSRLQSKQQRSKRQQRQRGQEQAPDGPAAKIPEVEEEEEEEEEKKGRSGLSREPEPKPEPDLLELTSAEEVVVEEEEEERFGLPVGPLLSLDGLSPPLAAVPPDFLASASRGSGLLALSLRGNALSQLPCDDRGFLAGVRDTLAVLDLTDNDLRSAKGATPLFPSPLQLQHRLQQRLEHQLPSCSLVVLLLKGNRKLESVDDVFNINCVVNQAASSPPLPSPTSTSSPPPSLPASSLPPPPLSPLSPSLSLPVLSLSRCPFLRILDISYTQVSDLTAALSPTSCPSLSLLNARHTPLKNANFLLCAGVAAPSLTATATDDEEPPAASSRGCQEGGRLWFRHLETLDLGDTQVADLTPLSFGGCRRLKHLHLDGAPLESVAVSRSNSSHNAANDSGGNDGGDGDGVEGGALPLLETLHLGRTKIQDLTPLLGSPTLLAPQAPTRAAPPSSTGAAASARTGAEADVEAAGAPCLAAAAAAAALSVGHGGWGGCRRSLKWLDVSHSPLEEVVGRRWVGGGTDL